MNVVIKNPSPNQWAIQKEFTTTNNNIVCAAVAGSGKSTTITWLMGFVPAYKYILYCAFNKSIADEFKVKCKGMNNVKISTIHGMGYSILKKAYNCGDPNGTKYRKLVLNMSADWKMPEDGSSDILDRVLKLVDLLRLNFVKTMQEAVDVANKYSIDNMDGEVEYAIQVIEAGRSIVKDIDFTDMIYLPLYYNLEPGFKHDVVMIDEMQDLNTCQRMLVMKHIKKGGKFVAVGDRCQAIYSFAGADAASFDKIVSYPNTVTLPLSVNYRCPTTVIEYLQKNTIIGTDIQAHDNAPLGVVNMKGSINDVETDHLVLSRYNMPLAKLCIDYLMRGIKAYIKGKDIGENLCNLIAKSKKTDMNEAMDWLYKDLDKIKRKLVSYHRLPEADIEKMSSFVNMSDKLEAIRIITAGCKTSAEGIQKIRNIFADKSTGICLSTIHKAKGLEADHVHIACDWLMPSAYAKTDEERLQERNLQYVAYSRSRVSLNFITDFDPYKKD